MTPCFLYAYPLKPNKTYPLTTCHMPSSLITLLQTFLKGLLSGQVCVCVCACACRCASIGHLICVYWVYICYFDLQACLCACLHVSDCPGADARHIIVNPLICLVYTNALIWKGGPIHCSLGSKCNLLPNPSEWTGNGHDFSHISGFLCITM